MTRKSKTLRRALTLSIATILLALSASQVMANGGARHAKSHGAHKASLHIGFGFHGPFFGYSYRPYRHHAHRYSFYPRFSYYGHYGYGYGYSPYYGRYDYPRYGSRTFGGLDLNVKPKKTQIYIDGNYVGVANNFDGWPEHLWLEKDGYELIFYNPGYKTVVRQVEVRPGVVLDIREQMQPGESIPVEELTRATAKRPAPRSGAPAERQPPAAAERDRFERDRVETDRTYNSPPEPRQRPPARPEVLDARPAPARVLMSVAPADASVYLDGHFLGIAGKIGEQRDGILIDPGEHQLEIVRPGYRNHRLTFTAEPGEKVELEVELDAGGDGTGPSA